MSCALATLGEFRALCPSQATASDTAVSLSLIAASAAAERYTGREFRLWDGIEYYDGNGYPNLPLNHWPIVSVTSVYLDLNGGYGQVSGSFSSTTQLTAGLGFVVQATQGFLQRWSNQGAWPIGGIGPAVSPWGYPGLARRGTAMSGWPKVPGCVKVTYSGGYAEIPADVKVAVCAMADYALLATDNGGLMTTSQSYIDASVGSGFLTEALARGNVPALGSARGVLDSYKDVRTATGIF